MGLGEMVEENPTVSFNIVEVKICETNHNV